MNDLHFMRRCGLKQAGRTNVILTYLALRMGAWIETEKDISVCIVEALALRARVWIETTIPC